MALYFLVLEGDFFHQQARPALAESWRQRSFAPLLPLCSQLAPLAREFASRFHIAGGERMLAAVPAGQGFDRLIWRHLAGEILWVSALEIPEIQTSPDHLAMLLAPEVPDLRALARAQMPPIGQAHYGSRDLTFGSGFYQPESAGWNDLADVQRLDRYLGQIQPASWHSDNLKGPELASSEEREEALLFLRDWFPSLQALYHHAAQEQRILVCEEVEP